AVAYRRSILRALPWLAAGGAAMLMVRPYVAAFLACGFAAGMLIHRADPRLRSLAPFARAGSLLVTIGLTVVVMVISYRFLQNRVPLDEGLADVLQATSKGGQYGGSEFVPTVVSSPVGLPAAIFTVLFRPTLIEAGNVTSLVAALEGTALLILTVARFRALVTAVVRLVRSPFV